MKQKFLFITFILSIIPFFQIVNVNTLNAVDSSIEKTEWLKEKIHLMCKQCPLKQLPKALAALSPFITIIIGHASYNMYVHGMSLEQAVKMAVQELSKGLFLMSMKLSAWNKIESYLKPIF